MKRSKIFKRAESLEMLAFVASFRYLVAACLKVLFGLTPKICACRTSSMRRDRNSSALWTSLSPVLSQTRRPLMILSICQTAPRLTSPDTIFRATADYLLSACRDAHCGEYNPQSRRLRYGHLARVTAEMRSWARSATPFKFKPVETHTHAAMCVWQDGPAMEKEQKQFFL